MRTPIGHVVLCVRSLRWLLRYRCLICIFLPSCPGRLTALEIMHHLMSNPKIVIEALKKGEFVVSRDFRRLDFSIAQCSRVRLPNSTPAHSCICPCFRLNEGILVYLMDLFCSSHNPALRNAGASLMGKILNDKLRNPKVRLQSVCMFVACDDSLS